MLVVTHEMGFARNVSNQVVFMENGVVVEQAPSPKNFCRPTRGAHPGFSAEDRPHRIRNSRRGAFHANASGHSIPIAFGGPRNFARSF